MQTKANSKYYDAKFQVAHLSVDQFQRKERDRLKPIRSQLLANNALMGGSSVGFLASGIVVSDLTPFQRRGHPIRPVVDQLKSKAESYITADKALDANCKRIAQFLSVLCTHAADEQELRNLLPEIWVEETGLYASYTRTASEELALQRRPDLKPHYETFQNAFGIYNARRFLA